MQHCGSESYSMSSTAWLRISILKQHSTICCVIFSSYQRRQRCDPAEYHWREAPRVLAARKRQTHGTGCDRGIELRRRADCGSQENQRPQRRAGNREFSGKTERLRSPGAWENHSASLSVLRRIYDRRPATVWKTRHRRRRAHRVFFSEI